MSDITFITVMGAEDTPERREYLATVVVCEFIERMALSPVVRKILRDAEIAMTRAFLFGES